MKRIMSILLVLCLVFGVLPTPALAAASGTCGDSLTWSFDESTGTLTISGTGDMTDFAGASAPWYDYHSQIVNVKMESGVTSIGTYAFMMHSSMKSLEIPDTVVSIKEYALSDCDSLTAVVIPSGVTTIGESAFYSCDSLATLTISGDGVALGDYAFESCNALSKIYFSGDAPSFGDDVFYFVTATAYYPADNSTWTADVMQDYGGTLTWEAYTPGETGGDGNIPSGDCGDAVTWVLDADGVLTISGTGDMDSYSYASQVPWNSYRDSISKVVIEPGVTSIGGALFQSCTNLTEVSIPDGITSIGKGAFEGCSSLTAITIPASMESISEYAFNNCDSLTAITLPGSITAMGDYAFAGCASLAEVVISEGVAILGYGAFKSCTAMTSVTIPGTVSTIGSYAFQECSALTALTLNEGITSIGEGAFQYCALTEVTVPSTVSSIANHAFGRMTGLTVTFTGDTPSFGDYAFGSSTATVYYPGDNDTWTSDVMLDYGGTVTWKVIGGDDSTTGNSAWEYDAATATLTITGEGAMADYTVDDYRIQSAPWADIRSTVKTLIISDGITHIGDYAFYYFTELTRVVMADSVVSIGRSAFENCQELSAIELSENLITIGEAAFRNNSNLLTLYIGDKVESIGTEAFLYCYSLYRMTFLGNAPTLGADALGHEYLILNYPAAKTGWADVVTANTASYYVWTPYGSAEGNVASGTCGDNVSWLLDGNGVLTISGTGAISDYSYLDTTAPWYDYADQIVKVVVGEGITQIGTYAFVWLRNMTSISLPSTLTTLREGALEACNSLTTLVIPDSVTTIEAYAMQDCYCLSHLTLGSGLVKLGSFAFSADESLTYVFLPASLTQYDAAGLAYCMRLAWIEVDDCNPTYCNDAYGVMYSKDMTTLHQMGSGYEGAYTIADTTTVIGENAFNNTTGLTAITIPNGVVTIEDSSFFNSHTITSLIIPDSVVTIGADAFEDCSALETVVIGDGTVTIGDYAFEDCRNITDITFGSSVETIGAHAFGYCNQIPSIVLPDSVRTIGDYAFTTCSAVTELGLSESLESLGFRSFHNCDNLITVTIPNSVTTLGEEIFYDCGSLEEIYLGTGVREVSNFMFYKCSALTDISIPSNVTSVGDYAFSYCTALTGIALPGSISTIGDQAFANCSALAEITIPASVAEFGLTVFGSCSALTEITFLGDAPSFRYDVFSGVTATAYYPGSNETWTEDVRQDYSGTITWVPYTIYKILEDSNTSVAAGGTEVITIHCGAEYSNFVTLYVDGVEVDSANYTVTEGSTIVTLHADYLSTLSPGVHSITLEFTDGFTHGEFTITNGHIHSYVSAVTAPTCTEQGYTTYTCACGDSYVDDYVDALGHTEETIPGKAATCTEAGLTEGKQCSVCGEILTEQEEIPALGHDFEDGACTVCGAADPDYVTPGPGETEPALDGVTRIAGADRIATSLGIADQLKETLGVARFNTMIVASALNFPDALTGSYLAAVKSAPILLTYEAAHPQIQAYIEANLASGGTVYILGGTTAVSAGFEDSLKSKGINVIRLAGSDRFGTNLEIMAEAGVSADQPILIATAVNFADSLSASAAGLPMVLVYGSLRDDQKEFLAGTSKEFIIIGGTSAVPESIENELKAIGSVTRLAGSSRYQTSVMVAESFVPDPDAVVLAYARNFPDGLCAGPLAVALNAPLILTENYDPSAADTYVNGISAGIVVGGAGLISDAATRAIFDLDASAEILNK